MHMSQNMLCLGSLLAPSVGVCPGLQVYTYDYGNNYNNIMILFYYTHTHVCITHDVMVIVM